MTSSISSGISAQAGSSRGIRLAVDAMGGDHGAPEVVPGALDHAAAHPEDHLFLVGDPERIRQAGGALPSNVEIVPASQVIEMHEHPALALREKKDASILVACDLVRTGKADAIVTAGHTGAAMAAAVLRIGRLPGVDRPGARRPDGPRAGARSCSSTSAPTPIRPPRTSPSTRGWARSSPSA